MKKYSERIKEILECGGLKQIPAEEIFILGYLMHELEGMPQCEEFSISCFLPKETCQSALKRIVKSNETLEIGEGYLKDTLTIRIKGK